MPSHGADPDAAPSSFLRSPERKPAAIASDFGALAASVVAGDDSDAGVPDAAAEDGDGDAGAAAEPGSASSAGGDGAQAEEEEEQEAGGASDGGTHRSEGHTSSDHDDAPTTPAEPAASSAGDVVEHEDETGGNSDGGTDQTESDDAQPTTPPPPPPSQHPWTTTRRHMLVTTAAGKPILALGCGGGGGDDAGGQVAGLAAAGAALVEYAEGMDDGLISLSFPPSTTLLFTRHGHLRFITASSLGEPAAALAAAAAAAHGALVALATTALHTALDRAPGLDAGRLLGQGAADVVSAALGDPDTAPLAVAGAYAPFPLPARRRSAAAAALAAAADASNATAAALLASDASVIALAGGWHAGDARAVAAVLTATRDAADRDALVPVCLPVARGGSFVHAYVRLIEDDGGAVPITLALLLPSPDGADAARAAADVAADALRSSGVLQAVAAARPPTPSDVGGAATGCVTHFAARSAARRQLLSSRVADGAGSGPPPGGLARARAALIGGGIPLGAAADGVAVPVGPAASSATSAPGAAARPPARCYWEETPTSSLLALRSAEYELYVSVAPGTSVAAASAAARAVGAWVRARAGDLFVPVADG